MRFLEIVIREGAVGEDSATAGEKAVPNLPTGERNTFLGLTSFKPALYAKVVEVPRLSLDDLAIRLRGRFISLPESVLNAYILQTAKLANTELKLGNIYQCYLADDGEEVTLRDIKLGTVHTLWHMQPIPENYR